MDDGKKDIRLTEKNGAGEKNEKSSASGKQTVKKTGKAEQKSGARAHQNGRTQVSAPAVKMSRNKKLAIAGGCTAAVILLLILLIFVFDVFGLFTSKYRLNYDKYITLGKYKGLQYTKVSTNVTKSEIQQQINSNLAAKQTTTEVKKGKVKKGDTVVIKYTGKINGKTFSGGSADNYSLQLGSGSMISGFESGLYGKAVGSTATLNLKFPKNYSEKKLAGKKVVFTVKIKSKTVTKTPKYTVAFVKANSKYKTKKDYEASIKKSLQATKKQNAEAQEKNEILSQILESTKVKKYPDKQVDYEKEAIVSANKKAAKQQYSMSWSDYLKANNMTKSSFNKWARNAAKQTVKIKLVTYSIAKKEDIDLTSNKEYKSYLKKLLKQAGFTEDSFKSQYNETIEDYANEQGIRFNLDENKVMNKIMKYSKEKTGKSSEKKSGSSK